MNLQFAVCGFQKPFLSDDFKLKSVNDLRRLQYGQYTLEGKQFEKALLKDACRRKWKFVKLDDIDDFKDWRFIP